MTTPDYRALCAELVEKIHYTWGDIPSDMLELMDRARALLAAPEAVGVADEELDRIYWNLKPTEIEHCWRVYARAVLSRYGTAHPAPVPVGERLPGVGDCNADGRCWIHQPSEVSPEAPDWVLLHRKYASEHYMTTHWLPHWALPLPGDQ
jgi:hypothetical protein